MHSTWCNSMCSYSHYQTFMKYYPLQIMDSMYRRSRFPYSRCISEVTVERSILYSFPNSINILLGTWSSKSPESQMFSVYNFRFCSEFADQRQRRQRPELIIRKSSHHAAHSPVWIMKCSQRGKYRTAEHSQREADLIWVTTEVGFSPEEDVQSFFKVNHRLITANHEWEAWHESDWQPDSAAT